jgi:HD-GYP domain-containing protein (c-di-GMP phosphodiesterase class II)
VGEEIVLAEDGVRSVLLEAVRATDEALCGLDRAERTADDDGSIELDRVRTEVQHAARMILESLLGMVENETGRGGHSRRVAATARSIAEAMGMPRHNVIVLEDAARLHDVGELLLDWESLGERRELAASTRRALRRHPTIGERLLPTVGFDAEACRIVGAHHERLDGSGYPDRLSGNATPLGAQVLAVAEMFEALTNARPHRPAIPSSEALRRLRSEAVAGRLNTQAVEALAALSGEPKENGDPHWGQMGRGGSGGWE